MPQEITFPNFKTMVNYTNVLTSAANEIYTPTTDAPDSRAFLMKNTVTVDFSFCSPKEDKTPIKTEQSTSLSTNFQ